MITDVIEQEDMFFETEPDKNAGTNETMQISMDMPLRVDKKGTAKFQELQE